MLASNHNWNGFYIGGNAGIGTSLTSVRSLSTIFDGDNYVNGTGFTGGGQAGYNYLLWQKYLIGVEGDFGALAINHAVADWGDAVPPLTWLSSARRQTGMERSAAASAPRPDRHCSI
jgi:hypothetical protein